MICFLFLAFEQMEVARANIPGGGTGTGSNVTLTDNGATVTLANGIISIVVTKSDATIGTINYTYNNGSGTVTNPVLAAGDGGGGGSLYWNGNPASFGTMDFTYSIVANSGTFAEISLVSTSATNGVMEVDYAMLKGSTGFYAAATLTHRTQDGPVYIELRPNIYAGLQFNWMTVDSARNKLMEVSGGTMVVVPNAPKECYLWANGIYQGRYDDKYKYAADQDLTKVWGWTSVGTSGSNVGLWCVQPSGEAYPGGPLERSLMEHIGTTVLNVFTGGYYGMSQDGTIGNADSWTKVYGPYFYYFNNAPKTITDPVILSGSLYADARAQQTAEQGAWPYSWYNNSNYAQATNRGTVTGTIVISDSGNPNASAAGLWVGVVQQPAADDTVYDFQQWCRPYQFWTQTAANGSFTIPTVISGTNYTLYAFGPGSNDTFMSQAQTGGTAPLIIDLPATPFSVAVTGGATTSLGTITWKPARVGPTMFEIGYPNRTANKFRHGDDYWVGDIGPSVTAPSPVWTKYLEYQFDFPNGPNYTVGSSRWSTDWNFIQPAVLSSAGVWNNSSSNINFTIPSGTSLTGSASFYLGLAVDYYTAIIVTVNGENLGSVTGLSAKPNASVPTSGYYVGYDDGDASIREGNNGAFSDERLTFPASLLKTGTNINTINIGIRQVGGGYFANHAMYDYARLELTGYLPPPPGSATAFAGNHSALVTWPVVPGANSYNILRSTTSGSGYTSLATGIVGPVCGSGSSSATYVDATAADSTPYYYVVRSVNVTGTSANSPQSASVTPLATAPTTAPAAPTGLAVSATNAAVTLNWAASTGANYYTVLRSTLYNNGGSIYNASNTYNLLSTIVLSNTVTGTTYTDTTPTNGSTYAYSLMASNAVGASATTTAVNAEPLPPAPSAVPGGVLAQPGAEQITVSWGTVSGAQGYILQEATSSGGTYSFVASITTLNYTVTGLADNTTYYYTVTAVNAGGVSGTSSVVSATTAPAAPAGLAAIAGNTQVTLTWSPSAAATSYVVSRSTSAAGTYTTIGTSNGTAYTDTGLTNGTTYYYEVAASNANGTGLDSADVAATPVATVPVAPAGLTATAGYKQVVLNWSASSGATSYTVLSGTVSGGPYSSLASGITTTSSTNTGLVTGVTYYYVVEAGNAGGTGAYSNQASATPVDAPVALTWSGNVDTGWNDGSANWTSSGGAAVYSDPDGVTFDDTAKQSSAVITASVSPGSVTFNNSVLGYTISGGSISGTTSIVKTGTGSVTFTNVNGYSGGTTVSAGTVEIGVAGTTSATLGTGPISLANATTLEMADPSGDNYPTNSVSVAAGALATLFSISAIDVFGGNVSGSASSTITLSGPVSLGLSGTSQFSGFNGLISVPLGSQLKFTSTGGANGNGGASATFDVNGLLNTRNAAGSLGVVLGALEGGGSIQGQTNTATGNDIYFIGAKNIASIFSGTIADGANGITSLTKVGTGTLTLSGSNTYSGATSVTGGILKITGTTAGTTGVSVSSAATLYLAGGSLSVTGNIVNGGTFKLSGTPSLSLTGTFTNNGVLDLINGPSALPADFVNNGTVITATSVQILQTVVSGSDMNVMVEGYAEHTYQLQSATSLSPSNWQDVGLSQLGDNSVLTFTDTGGATGGSKFYRIQVTP